MSASNIGFHTEYNHNSKVDGSNKYGSTFRSFPRRGLVGSSYEESGTSRCGSRSLSSYNNTARIPPGYSAHMILYKGNDS